MQQQTKPVEAAQRPSPSPATGNGESRLTLLLSFALAAFLGLMTAGLLAAMAGLHHAIVVGPLAAIIGAALFKALPNNLAIPRLSRAVAVSLALVVLAAVVSNVLLRANLVVAGRDGGTYANTASFLVDGANLFPDAIAEPFIDQDLEFASPGFVVRDDGTFWQQFLHSTSSALGFVGELFGRGAMFSFNGVLSGVGILSLFALGRRFMGEWWALAAAALMAATLPYVHYARGTFTEVGTLVLVSGGLWAAHVAIQAQPRFAFGAGLLLGGAATVRVDAWMVGVSLAALLFVTVWLSEQQETWVARRLLTGFAVMAILGLIDIAFFAEPYLGLVGKFLIPLIAAVIMLRVLMPMTKTDEFQKLANYVQRNRHHVANLVTIAVSAVLIYLWFIRPLLGPSRANNTYGLEPIQIREGLTVDTTRNYAEQSVWWLTWYLGVPLTAVGFAGFVAALRQSIAKGSAAIRLAVLIFAVPAVTYLIRPSVNPDQIWAIRRYTPVVLPGLILFAFGLLAHYYAKQAAGTRIRSLIVAVAVVISLPVLFISAPLIAVADRPGVEAQFSGLCDSLGDAESVLLVNDVPERPLSGLLGPPLRAWCGVSIAGAAPQQVGAIAADAVIASDPTLIPGGAQLTATLEADAWEASLTGAPDATEVRSIELFVGFPGR